MKVSANQGRLTFAKVLSGNIWVDIVEGEIYKLDNIKCIATNSLWNSLANQFREKLPAIKNRHGEADFLVLVIYLVINVGTKVIA